MTDTQVRRHPIHNRAQQAVALRGIGTAVPAPISQSDAATVAEGFSCESDGQRAWLRRVFLRSAIEQRCSVLMNGGPSEIRAFYPPAETANPHGPSTSTRMQRYAREASLLAQQASTAALQNAQCSPQEITHLITVSCTGFFAPGLDVELITRLGLRPDIRRTHIGFMGCHAAFNALAAAQDAVRANPDNTNPAVLVCCVELSTLHFAYGWQPEKLVANALFADGAAACIVGRESLAPSPTWHLLKTASLLLPNSRHAMSWNIGDHGFEMTLSSELPALIHSHIRPWCQQWLGNLGIDLQEITRWAIHPGGPKILNAAREALGLTPEDLQASYDVMRTHGNMSSATVLFVLQQLAQNNPPPDPNANLCVAIGFGPGLMAEGMLLQWS